MRRLERDQGEVEGAVELFGIGVSVELHPALFAEVVDEKAVSSHPLDVSLVRVEHSDASHLPRHLRRCNSADGSCADDENAGLDHNSPPSFPASTGGNRSSSSFSAA